jgi:mutual gliding-motility protein MglA
MARIDLKNKTVQAKLVYYGPGLCGKTTNLQYINAELAGGQELMSLATEGDRTIFFDFMPLELGKLRGLDVQFKLYTVPGQVRYNQTRKMVLKNVDGVVFVADSQAAMLDANLESLDNLFENLKELGIDAAQVPLILQYNKRDLPSAMSTEELDRALNPNAYPTFLAAAATGTGVVETLKEACKHVLQRLAASFPEPAPERERAAPPSRSADRVAPTSPFDRIEARLTSLASSRDALERLAEEVARRRDLEALAAAVAPLPRLSESIARAQREISSRLGELTMSLGWDSGGKDELHALSERIGQLPTRADLARLTEGWGCRANGSPPAATLDLSPLEGRLTELPRRADLEALGARLCDLPARGELSTLAERLADLASNAALSALSERIAELPTRAELSALSERIAELPTKAELSVLSSRVSDLPTRAELAALSERIAELPTKAELSALGERMNELPARAELSALSKRVDELPARAELSALGERMNELPARAELSALSDRIDELPTRAELSALSERSDELPAKAELPAPGERPAEVPEGAQPTASEPAAQAVEPEPAAVPETSEPEAPAAAPEPPVADQDPAHQNAARVARVMVADLYLYNREQVEAGIKHDDFFDRNKEALDDMRLTYESRVPAEVREQRDHLMLAIQALIEKKKKPITP